MKICKKCGIEKDLSEFGKDKSKKDGYSIYCKECRNIRQKKYSKKYYDKNRTERLEYAKKYHEDNKDKDKERKRLWYQKNRERILPLHREYSKKYYRNKNEVKSY